MLFSYQYNLFSAIHSGSFWYGVEYFQISNRPGRGRMREFHGSPNEMARHGTAPTKKLLQIKPTMGNTKHVRPNADNGILQA